MRRAATIICNAAFAGALCLAAQQPAPAPTQAAPKPTLRVLVIDAAHGGADAGARGPSGVQEMELTLFYATSLRAELERQGWRVVLTRQGTENPTFDERSAVANAQRDALFLTLHVSSNGPAGTARTYYSTGRSLGAPDPSTPARAGGPNPSPPDGFLRWEQAQLAFAEQSRRLAELLQVQLGRVFRGSPEVPQAAGLRQFRSVAAPAVAVEISSVDVKDRKVLERMAPQLAEAVLRAVTTFRSVYEASGR